MPHVSVDLTKNLLAEETTIDPSNPFPSFLEMKLAQETTEAAEKAIRTSIAAGIDHFNRIGIGTVAAGSAGSAGYSRSMKQKLAVLLSRALARYRSEVELVVNYFILRRSLLSSASSTLAESLYGLKRSVVLKDNSLVKLEEMDGIRAALLLSFGPYLKLRLDAYYERMRDWYQDQHQHQYQYQYHHQPADEQSNMNQRPKTMASKLKKLRALFVHLYPFLHMSHNGIQLAYQFAFLIGKTNYFGPSQHFLGQVVRRITIADGKDAAGSSGGQTKAMKPLSEQIPEAALLRLKKAAVIGVASALLVGWIGKFRQEMRRNRIRWIVNGNGNGRGDGDDSGSGEGRERNGMSNATRNSDIVIPPPPLPFLARRFEDSVKPNSDHRLCPLCLQKRVNPAASSSGHVFCYKCLVLYIREKGPKCPLVGMRCDESQIVRLFEPSSHVQSINNNNQ